MTGNIETCVNKDDKEQKCLDCNEESKLNCKDYKPRTIIPEGLEHLYKLPPHYGMY